MSLRARIFLIYVLCVAGAFAWLAYWINGDLRQRYGESSEEVLVDGANLLAEQLATDWPLPLAQRFGNLAAAMSRLEQRRFAAQIYAQRKTTADLRVYITDNDGRLLYHSVPGHRPGEDFSRWTDVSRTLAARYGARTSDEWRTLPDGRRERVSVAWVAAPIFVGDTFVGVVSLGKPRTNIDTFLDSARSQLRNVVLATIAAAIAIGLLLYLWVTRPLQELVEYANSVSRGEPAPLPVSGDDEVGQLGEAMHTMRRALEDKAYVESYVQSLTHELKSPLTAIRASAELLADEMPPEARKAFAVSIERESARLNDIADRMLELASLERTRQLPRVEKLALFELAAGAADSVRAAAGARGVIITTQFSGADGVTGDPLLLRQAIDNLVRNAVDFSPQGGHIVVSGEAFPGEVRISVSDQGPGIPDYALERIFDRFYSLPRPHSGRKSTGLGLNFVREVAQLHGGRVLIESPGSGTLARLIIPRQLVHR